jgi:hypothetical protein
VVSAGRAAASSDSTFPAAIYCRGVRIQRWDAGDRGGGEKNKKQMPSQKGVEMSRYLFLLLLTPGIVSGWMTPFVGKQSLHLASSYGQQLISSKRVINKVQTTVQTICQVYYFTSINNQKCSCS